MATRINVITTIDNLLQVIKPLLIKYEIDVYVDNFEKEKGLYHTPYNEEQLIGNNETYHKVFFLSKKVDLNDIESFYDDDVCVFCLECAGGRYTETEIEIIELRIVSKTPDKKIKSFSSALHNFLKKDNNFGTGVLPLTNSRNKNTLYHKGDVQHRIIWRDFQRKAFYEPIKIAE